MRNVSIDREIVPLTSIRGLAAIWVVAFHLAATLERHGFVEISGPPSRIVEGGQFAVDLFFLLSGYILTASYGLKPQPTSFFLHRVARIFPLHLAVLVTMALGFAAASMVGIQTNDRDFFGWNVLPFHITLTFVWFDLPLAWNAPTWSLSAEIAAYLTFPFVQAFFCRLGRASVWLALSILLTAHCAWLFTLAADTGIGALGRAILGFLAGMSLRVATYDHQVPSFMGYLSAAAIVILAIAKLTPLAVFPAALLLVALASNDKNKLQRVMTARPLKWAGDVSYSIYVLHAPLAILTFLIARRLEPSTGGTTIVVTAYFVILLFASNWTWRYIERPARLAIRHLSIAVLSYSPRATIK